MKSKYLDGDRVGLSKTDQQKLLKHYQQTKSGLFIPAETQKRCGGCGRETYNLKTEEYFGEEFCVDCVEKWKHGAK